MTNSNAIKYPKFEKDKVVDVLHGHEVHDPYRWLENPDSDATKNFVAKQNELFDSYIDKNTKNKIFDIAESLQKYARRGAPFKRGKYYYYSHNEGLQNQDVIYQTTDVNVPGKIFLNPNEWSKDGTVALSAMSFTKDGKYLAYSISKSGSDWTEIKFKNVETGEDLNDVLSKVKFGAPKWTRDNKGVFYPKYEVSGDGTETTQNKNQMLYYHKIGTDQSTDIKIFDWPEFPERMFGVEITNCGKYLVLYISESCDPKNLLYVGKIENKQPEEFRNTLKPIISEFIGEFNVIANDDDKFWVSSTYNASRGRILQVDNIFDNIHPSKWKVFLDQDAKGGVIQTIQATSKDRIVLNIIRDVCAYLEVRNLYTGNVISTIDIPLGDIVSSNTNRDETEFFFKFASYISPGTIYKVDTNGSKFDKQVLYETKVNNIDFGKYEIIQKKVKSKDKKADIPLFIVQSKTKDTSKPSPCLLYAYGGFNISMTPFFSTTFLTFLEIFKNSCFAVACLRGGGEYGIDWYQQGVKEKKQNVFDDFFSCAEYLSDNKYTSAEYLTCMGGSNGGTLVGAAFTQQPHLFKAAISQVPVMDMYRFHKFTIGHAWISDFGNPDIKEEFEAITKWSPLHNIKKKAKKGKYPNILIMTADHDDRVVPLHSLKFIATAQEIIGDNISESGGPILVRVDVDSGHGAGKSTKKRIEEVADMYAFVSKSIGVSV